MAYFKDKTYKEEFASEYKLLNDVLDSVKLKGREKLKIIEIGIGTGQFFEVWKKADEVIAIDNLEAEPQMADEQKKEWIEKTKATVKKYKDAGFKVLEMDSTEAAYDIEREKYHVIFVDGDHSYGGCAADVGNYIPKLKKGGYIILHDSRANKGIMHGGQEVYWWPGPTKVADELKVYDGEFTDAPLLHVGEAFTMTVFQK